MLNDQDLLEMENTCESNGLPALGWVCRTLRTTRSDLSEAHQMLDAVHGIAQSNTPADYALGEIIKHLDAYDVEREARRNV